MATASERISAARQMALEKKYELENRSPELTWAGTAGIFLLMGGMWLFGLLMGWWFL